MGIIFDIKEFSVHDGPGVRQTVFLKGCPLMCTWCHNPEGQDPEKRLLIRRHECLNCLRCADVCEEMDAVQKNAGKLMADSKVTSAKEVGEKKHVKKIAETCKTCGKCINTCPKHIRWICGEELSADELAARINKNADIYDDMNGGVTFSGGEPLMQAEFLIDVMKKLPGVHKVVETCGYASGETFRKVYELADLIMCDIKLMDSDAHKKYTGVDNKHILENISFMKEADKEFIIRIPLIPGITDTKENLTVAAEFLKGARRLKFVELLSYNTMAGAKYEWVGKNYEPGISYDNSLSYAEERNKKESPEENKEKTDPTEIFKSRNINCKWSKS